MKKFLLSLGASIVISVILTLYAYVNFKAICAGCGVALDGVTQLGYDGPGFIIDGIKLAVVLFLLIYGIALLISTFKKNA